MAYEIKDDFGTLFRVPDEEKKSEKSPGYKGDARIRCPHCNATFGAWMSAWVKESVKGKFFSLAFKAKVKPPQEQGPG